MHMDQEDKVDITINSLHPGAIFTNIVSSEVGQTIPKGKNYHILPFIVLGDFESCIYIIQIMKVSKLYCYFSF